jgi:hemerythrin-like domain-containing protein
MAVAKPPGGEGDADLIAEPRLTEPPSGIAEARALLADTEAPRPEAFLDPLEIIRNDHFRQLRMCNVIDAFTQRLEVEPVKELAGALLEFLRADLPRHSQDEEQDLFPALKRRCLPEDGIDEVLRQLVREHDLDRDLIDFIVDDLEALADGVRLNNPVRLLMNVREFSEMQRRHLTREDRVVLPLARQRLTPEDLTEIGRNMAARRKLPYPG